MCLWCGNREGYDIEDGNFGKSHNESFSTSQTVEVGQVTVITDQPTNGTATVSGASSP